MNGLSYKTKLALLTLVFIAGALLLQGLFVAAVTLHPPKWDVFGPDIFYYLMAVYEPFGLVFVIACSSLFVFLQRFSRKSPPVSFNFSPLHVALLALAVFLFCFWGSSAICHRFPLSMDEHAALYQAQIYDSGRQQGTLPESLRWLKASAVMPDFILLHEDYTFNEVYLPAYSVLLAIGAKLFGTPWIVNPLMAAGTVLLLYGVARNVNYSKLFTGWTVVFLLTSAQFLVNGFTGFAMTSHLFFSVAWLYFYTHPDRRLFYIAPLLGVVAMGLHQPVPHLIFVWPFLLRLLLEWRLKAAVYSAAVYFVGGLAWLHWLHVMRPAGLAQSSALFAFPDFKSGMIFFFSALLLITWQGFLMILFNVAAAFKVRSMPPFVRDLALSAVTTVLFYLFFTRCQGSGWGYRYMFPVLGNLCLIAAWAAASFAIPRLTVAVFVVVALGLQLPFRCIEVNQVLMPQLAVHEMLYSHDADFVVIDRMHAWCWFTPGFVRNGPDFSTKPLVLYREYLSDEQYQRLLTQYRTITILPADYLRLGIPPVPN